MEPKLQLRHPTGKKAVSMDKEKYDTLKKAILSCLKANGDLTHKELQQAVIKDFKKNKIKFEGSVEWHMEWVKLDLEARKEIKRIGEKSDLKFAIA
jgi:RNA:NAD 2'-phosphotransferase (TPT1/KptA family)